MLKPPFRAENAELLYKKILLGKYDKLSSYYSQEFSNFIDKLLTLNQKKRPCTKELLCESKMLSFKNEENVEDDEKQLMGTIKFPKNLKFLNENLPKSKY